MLERLLDEERIAELDLGAGDDPYKRLWATRRRERIGLVAFDPLTWRGAAGALRQGAAGAVRCGVVTARGRAKVLERAMRHGRAG
jgi:CelD/BcsL family acetyltransferase involved in cellulose biosynthesis